MSSTASQLPSTHQSRQKGIENLSLFAFMCFMIYDCQLHLKQANGILISSELIENVLALID